MFTAQKANSVSNNALKSDIACVHYILSEIERIIMASCSIGGTGTQINAYGLPEKNLTEAIDVLIDNGFIVDRKEHMISISWDIS